jgi:hypothetical protein
VGKGKKLLANEEFLQLEFDLDTLYSDFLGEIEKEDDKVLVLEKEKIIFFLLTREEETWR